jgi:cellobiose transport system substrate-binding protein
VKRVIATAAAVAVAALLVVRCTPGSGGDSGSSDPKTFEFWSLTEIDQKREVDAYTKARPDVNIKLTEVGSTTDGPGAHHRTGRWQGARQSSALRNNFRT